MAFRPDIEGLRAVAVGAVLVAHAGLAFGAGGFVGVDVFYVISGFLITGILVREVERRGTLSLVGFYARRARRLLPAAALVIVFVLAASAVLLTPAKREVVTGDAIASSLYYVNWRFVAQSADYFADATSQSPLQHFWSLAVEEQFYLVWPLLILAVTAWLPSRRISVRSALAIVIGAITVASLIYSATFDSAIAGEAYFSSFTRAWELGLGALIALVPVARLRPPLSGVLALTGLGAIAFSVFAFDESTRFPGTAALVPCLGTAAVIIAGTGGRAFKPLTLGPVRYVGRISYSLYLWHWPALILVAARWGEPTTLESVAIVLASFVPAILTYHFVEQPVLRARSLGSRPRRSLLVGAGCTAAGLLAAGVVVAAQPEFDTASRSDVEGARVVERGQPIQESATAVRPNPLEAGADKGRLADDGCLINRDDVTSGECAYGPPESKRKVVLFGDSHAMQYFPAIEELAKDKGWRLTGLTKQGCTPAEAPVFNPSLQAPYPECDEWRERMLERIEDIDGLDMVILSGASFYSVVENGKKLGDAESKEILEDGYAKTLERLEATGADVVVMADIPHAQIDVSDCVSDHLDSLRKCSFPLSDAKNTERFEIPAAARVPGVEVLDVTPLICPDDVCRAVIGDAIVYRGSNHMTATFASTLEHFMREELPDVDGR